MTTIHFASSTTHAKCNEAVEVKRECARSLVMEMRWEWSRRNARDQDSRHFHTHLITRGLIMVVGQWEGRLTCTKHAPKILLLNFLNISMKATTNSGINAMYCRKDTFLSRRLLKQVFLQAEYPICWLTRILRHFQYCLGYITFP